MIAIQKLSALTTTSEMLKTVLPSMDVIDNEIIHISKKMVEHCILV